MNIRGPFLALALPMLTLACGDTTKSQAMRAVLLSQIKAANAQGIDPIKLPPKRLALLSIACATLSGLSSVVRPDAVGLPEELAGWCGIVIRAAGRAD